MVTREALDGDARLKELEDPKERAEAQKTCFNESYPCHVCERSCGHLPYPHDKIGFAKTNHTHTLA